jgi:hypothetical protein
MTTREIIRTTVQQRGFWIAVGGTIFIVGLGALLLLLLWPEAFVYLVNAVLHLFGRGTDINLVIPQ